MYHYQKAKIPTVALNKMAEKVEELYDEFRRLMKLNPERREDNPKIKDFQQKLCCTMPFWPGNVEERMDQSKKGKDTAERLLQYPNKTVSASGTKAFSKHTWYLTEELVPLALFSDHVSPEKKTSMTEKLMILTKADSFPKRHGTGFGKPLLPKVDKKTELSECVGESSWNLFSVLEINTDFLKCPVGDWVIGRVILFFFLKIKNG